MAEGLAIENYKKGIGKFEELMRVMKNVNPSQVITYILPAERENHYVICLKDKTGNLEYAKKTLSKEEFEQFKKTLLFIKSCTVSCSRYVPAKVLVKETGVIRGMSGTDEKFERMLQGAKSPDWLKERKQLASGVSHFLSVMDSVNRNPAMSEDDMRKFLYWIKKYNFNLNVGSDVLNAPGLVDMPMEGFGMQLFADNDSSGSIDSTLLCKFLGGIPDRKAMQQELIKRLIMVQQAHIWKCSFGIRAHNYKSGDFKSYMCSSLSYKPLPLAFRDLAFYLYEKWGVISEGLPEECMNLGKS